MNNQKIVFKGEIPVSMDNLVTYDKIFEIETWMRRIIFACLMIEYGLDWHKIFPDNEIKKVERKIEESKENPLLKSYESDNLMWYTNIFDLRKILNREDISDIFLEITGSSSESIRNNLESLTTVRNNIAHNRIITIESLKMFLELSNEFYLVINEFKSRYINNNDYKIKHTEWETDNVSIKYFLKRMLNNDWSKFQAFIADDENLIQVVQLPAGINFEHPYIDLDLLLKKYDSVLDSIMGFFICKSGCEYCVLWSKHETINTSTQKKIIDIFLDSKYELWIDTDYKFQQGEAVFNPLLWFYD